MISFTLQQKLEITQFNSRTDTKTHHSIMLRTSAKNLMCMFGQLTVRHRIKELTAENTRMLSVSLM